MNRGIYQATALAVLTWLQHGHASASTTALPLAMGLEQVGRAITGPVTFWLGVISLIASGVVLYVRGEGFDSFGGRLAMAGLIFGGRLRAVDHHHGQVRALVGGAPVVIPDHAQARFVWTLFVASLLPMCLSYLWAITPVFSGKGVGRASTGRDVSSAHGAPARRRLRTVELLRAPWRVRPRRLPWRTRGGALVPWWCFRSRSSGSERLHSVRPQNETPIFARW